MSGVPSRSLIWRAQRRHSQRCYRIGALQRLSYKTHIALFNDLVESDEILVMADSVAVHRADCFMLGQGAHYAVISKCMAAERGLKSKQHFKTHRLFHRTANTIKQDTAGQCEQKAYLLDGTASVFAAIADHSQAKGSHAVAEHEVVDGLTKPPTLMTGSHAVADHEIVDGLTKDHS